MKKFNNWFNNATEALEKWKCFDWGKQIFDVNKIKFKTNGTWADWIRVNTKISEAYATQHKELALLESEYPKLENVAVSYIDMFNINKNVMDIFVLNVEIGM